MDLDLAGLRALVTGAGGGIGSAVARALAGEGVGVALVDRSEEPLRRLAGELEAVGRESSGASSLCWSTADVTDEDEVAAAVRASAERLGGLDVLILAAGISGPVGRPLSRTTVGEWEAVFAVNVTGSFLCLRAALPWLRQSRAPSVVMVASDSALVASPGLVPYCASKAAVLQMARATAVELAPDGIRVNAVCPSIVDTPMSRGDMDLPAGFEDAEYPVQSAAEVAAQVLFLSSPIARPLNASALVSDFGFSAKTGFPV